MKCMYCGGEHVLIFDEEEPIKAWHIILAVVFFPLGLVFVVFRGKQTVKYCPDCGRKTQI